MGSVNVEGTTSRFIQREFSLRFSCLTWPAFAVGAAEVSEWKAAKATKRVDFIAAKMSDWNETKQAVQWQKKRRDSRRLKTGRRRSCSP